MRTETTETDANVIRLAVSNPIITYEQLRDVKFDPLPQFIDSSKALDHHATRWSFLDSMTRVAIVTLGKSKPKLIEMAAGHQDTSNTILKDLGEAAEEAKLLLSLIEMAQWRMAAALANVCDDDDDMPDMPA